MSQMDDVDVAEPAGAERARRQAAVDYARASLMLSGLTLSHELELHAHAFVSGELTLIEFTSSVEI